MDARAIVAAALLAGFSGPGTAQLAGSRTSEGCILVADPRTIVVAEGRLSEGTFEDDYGTERAFILELPQAVCLDDSDGWADPDHRFTRVHVSTSDDALWPILRRAVGRNVSVRGVGFAAHTRHHHAPLVVIANQVTVH